MSTNINGWTPDAALIEQIANELFTGNFAHSYQQPASGNAPSSDIHTPVAKQDPGYGGTAYGLPASVAGSGISPSAVHQGNAVDIADPQTSLPDPNGSGEGIPASVAGSGISPAAINEFHAFNLDNPQTAFPDPQLQGGIPASFTGSGAAPFGTDPNASTPFNAAQPLTTGYLALEEISPFQKELEIALSGTHSYIPSAQVPFSSEQVLNSPQYYFAPGFSSSFSETRSLPQQEGFAGLGHFRKPPFDLNIIRNDFPILSEIVNGKQLVWLDNAATTQKPRQVIERLAHYYFHENSNIHRAAHTLAARATDAYEEAREIVRGFINARSTNEIVFVRGTTEAINLIAQSWGDQHIKEGDEIIVSQLEHHANIVPWQLLSQKKGAKLKVIPVDDNGELLLDEYAKLITPRTKIVSVTQVSNALGTVNPVKQIIDIAHQAGIKVLVDGAQSISHIRTDVQYLDADWFVFSGHKIYGPTGIGVVYGKEEILNATQPWQGGGNMIKDVTFENTQFHEAPTRFEAGTGNIADAVGLGAALQYVSKVGIDAVHQYETGLIGYAIERLKSIPGLHIIGNAKEKAGAISFVLEGIDTVRVGGLLNKAGIAVRAGHHCAQPILRRFGLEATVRPSFAFYNTCAEIDALVEAVYQIKDGQIK